MIGKTISHYQILKKLGEGGMGAVYQARDIRLDRIVALKFPHVEIHRDELSLSRFKREAKAAAALDHSSICHMYEYDEVDGRPYLVMAFIEGDNLRDRISKGPLPLDEALRTAIDVAEGLKEAHRHHIIHRDIKASNIMIAEDRQAKILDFGLAQITGATRLTRTDRTVGTVSYMAPEQASGGNVDHRTDIWSLGVVIYEMITGQLPFRADYEAALLYAIMNQQPIRASTLQSGIPREMDWVIDKCLAKDPEGRYRDVSELLKDLRAIRKKISAGDVPELPTWILRYNKRLLVAAVALLMIIAVMILAALGVRPFAGWRQKLAPWLLTDQPPQGATLRITAGTAWSGKPSLSPDGTRIAYVSDKSGNRDVYVIDAHGGDPLQLTFDPAADDDPVWLPDGHAIAFTSLRSGAPAIWRVGQLGGGATLVLPNASEPSISLDGRRIAFVRTDDAGNGRIWFAEMSDPASARQLTSDADGAWSHREPAWNPDGSTICYRTRHGLWAVRIDGAPAYPLTRDGQIDLDPAWASDGRHIYFSSFREGTLALWRIRNTAGKAQRLTPGTGPESHPSLSRDRTRIAYTTESSRHNLVVLDLETGRETQLESLRDDWMPTLAPDDGRIVFVSDRWGTSHDLWIQDLADGAPFGTPRRLATQPGDAAYPVFSPDGRWIAFYRILDGRRDIMTLSVAEGLMHQITENPADDVQPTWAPDGAGLGFASMRSGEWQIWTIAIEDGRPSGEPRQLTQSDASATAPAWSPDGRRIAFVGYQGNRSDVFVIELENGHPIRQITQGAQATSVAWDPLTGELLIAGMWNEEKASLRRFSQTGQEIGPMRFPVVFGEQSSYTQFAVSVTGRIMVYVRQQLTGDVWLLESIEHPY